MAKQEDKELKAKLLEVILEQSSQANLQIWWPFAGASMLPHIKEGNMLLIQRDLRHIRLGNVVVFKSGEELIAHRVVSIRRHDGKTIYLTKGDNRRVFDPPVHETSLVGKVAQIRRGEKLIDMDGAYSRFLNLLIAAFSYIMAWFYKFAKVKFF